MNAVTGSSVNGHLRIRCSTRADGTPFLSEQDFRPPVHLGKAHHDAGALIVTIVNPTAGFFDGDRLEMTAQVDTGSRLVLSTPSSSRVFRTRSGKAAICDQMFQVASGGFLEWIPEAFIPHSGATYIQRTHIDLEEGAGLLYVDWISPGRVARGEVFEFESLRWELDLRVNGRLVAREKYTLAGPPEGITAMFPEGQFVSVYVAGEMVRNWPEKEISALSTDDAYLGHGDLEGGAKVIRAICRDSLTARRLIEQLRLILHAHADISIPALGRIFM